MKYILWTEEHRSSFIVSVKINLVINIHLQMSPNKCLANNSDFLSPWWLNLHWTCPVACWYLRWCWYVEGLWAGPGHVGACWQRLGLWVPKVTVQNLGVTVQVITCTQHNPTSWYRWNACLQINYKHSAIKIWNSSKLTDHACYTCIYHHIWHIFWVKLFFFLAQTFSQCDLISRLYRSKIKLLTVIQGKIGHNPRSWSMGLLLEPEMDPSNKILLCEMHITCI